MMKDDEDLGLYSSAMQDFTVTFWQNKQIKQQTISAPTFDTAYKKFRSERPFVKILRIEE